MSEVQQQAVLTKERTATDAEIEFMFMCAAWIPFGQRLILDSAPEYVRKVHELIVEKASQPEVLNVTGREVAQYIARKYGIEVDEEEVQKLRSLEA